MNDMSILNESLAQGMLIALISAGLFYLIFLYHIIKGLVKAGKQNVKIKQTLSYGYIVGGMILFGIHFLFILGFMVEVKNRIIQNIISGTFAVVLFLSPAIILLFGYYYNRVRYKKRS
jgi:uncharacterized membrane protein YdfJ with MMPL/SSD domain